MKKIAALNIDNIGFQRKRQLSEFASGKFNATSLGTLKFSVSTFQRYESKRKGEY